MSLKAACGMLRASARLVSRMKRSSESGLSVPVM